MRNVKLLTVAFLSIFALEGCAGGMGGMAGSNMGNYPTQSPQYGSYPQQAQMNQAGVITNVRQVQMQGSQSSLPIGALLGAVAGGALGSQVGKGNGSIAAGIAGAALGGYAGNMVQSQQQGAGQTGLEITVRLNTGYTVVVTQAANQQFNIGERVRVVSDANGTNYVTR
jgi:outer membrane lipoprotein SlyB